MKGMVFLLSLLTATSYADAPLWTFTPTPLTSTSISVPSTGSATIQYIVTNQSLKSHTLDMRSIQGITQVTTAGNCTDPFLLSEHQSCVLNLYVNGAALTGNVAGGPVVCQQGNALQCYQPSAQDSLNITVVSMAPTATLSVSLPELVLQTSGTARIITITNSGSQLAKNLMIDYPTWPSGTTASNTCQSVLSPGSSCTVTVTPGPYATSDCNAGQGSSATPGVITIEADNSNTLTTDIYILTYGCIYQEGFIFAIDDTTSVNASISGETAGQYDIENNITWGSPSITTNATSLVDGPTNTALILTTEPSGSYAAVSCSEFEVDSSGDTPCISGECYTNWYLPAICQMGASGEAAGCSAGTPNIETNLQNLITGCSGSTCLAHGHWSSTEFNQSFGWYMYYQSGSGVQQEADKSVGFPVRCARDF